MSSLDAQDRDRWLGRLTDAVAEAAWSGADLGELTAAFDAGLRAAEERELMRAGVPAAERAEIIAARRAAGVSPGAALGTAHAAAR